MKLKTWLQEMWLRKKGEVIHTQMIIKAKNKIPQI